MEKIKLLLVDDHPLFLEGMRSYLSNRGILVAAMARGGIEALVEYEMTQPDIVLMDIQMNDMNGIESTRLIKKEYPEAVIVMLTSDEDEDTIFEALQAGASGYLLKGMEPEQLIEQLCRLRQGEMPLAPTLAKRMINLFSYQRSEERPFQEALTERQADILTMLTLGYKYKEIAAKLEIKEVTVKYHVREILNKFHVNNRTQLFSHIRRERT
jgi:two-component system NarL family response regulator